jgi:flagellar M-ring protein FliF
VQSLLLFFRQMGEGLADVWNRLSASARVNIGITLAVTVALILTLVVMTAREEYVDLYSGLDAKEVGPIQEVLNENSIPYRMASGQTAIQVPLSKAGEARLKLRERDLPSTHGLGMGWELLDQESMFTTPEKHKTARQRAIQGELQRQLNELAFVDKSFVYIHFAEESLLARRQSPSEASITLKVNRKPSRSEIEGIMGIVSTFGGPKLTRSHIRVLTTEGEVLHNPAEEESARLASSKQDLILQWEREREQKILEAFQELGRKAVVRVSAKLDFSKKTVVERKSSKGAELSVMETTTTLTTTESLPEGPPGAFQNLPEGVPGPTATTTEESTEETLTNNEPSMLDTTTVTEPGDVVGYKVSAIIDWGHKPVVGEDGQQTGEREYAALTDDEKEQWKLIIANAVGPEVTVDDVAVFDQPFQLEQLAAAQETFATLERSALMAWWMDFGMNLLKFVLVLAGFWLVRRWLLRAIAATEPEEVEEEIIIEAPGPSPDELRKREVFAEVEKLSQMQPDAVAALLRAWISESEE